MIIRRTAVAVAAAFALVASASAAGVDAQARPTSSGPAASAARAHPLPAPTGDTSPIHDPALVKQGRTWYVFSTGLIKREQGGTIRIARSTDRGRTWQQSGSVWDTIPAWIDRRFREGNDGVLPDNLWAPEIVKHGGTYYLYYSASTFGKNFSLTALATNTTLDPDDPDYRWVDRGQVIASNAGTRLSGAPDLEVNAIDASVVEDRAGKPWLAFGSFWNGLYVVPISWPSGKPARHWQSRAVQLAERPDVEFDPIEGAALVRHGGWYYLFASWDFCCQGANSTYKVAVGRSRQVTGPFRDKQGALMLTGGGTVLLQTAGTHVGAGGQSVAGNTLAYHYYDATHDYAPTLGLKTIRWVDGWPRLTS